MEKAIKSLTNIKNARNEIVSNFSKTVRKPKAISIVILNSPCHGFGDVIFAVKLRKYLVKWYPFATVHIATPKPDNFISIGEKRDSIISLKATAGREDCRRFKYLKVKPDDQSTMLDIYDLIFVAPLQQDYDVSLQDIKDFIPYSDAYNTYFFSEYNDRIDKKFDFHTGIGNGRLGMFFTDVDKKRKLASVAAVGLNKKEYALSYIAVTDTIPNFDQCYMSFFEMVTKKYLYLKKSNEFTIITPKAVANHLMANKKNIKLLHSYCSLILVITPDVTREFVVGGNSNKTLIIRGDIFPVPNVDMITLLANSVDDILLTGDQSITDALSCCPKKNIWYQIAPWKEGFVKELCKNLPQIHYEYKKTSCGTMKALNMKSDYREFVKTWDFRKLARGKMNQIVNMAISRKDPESDMMIDLVKSSRTVLSLRKKLGL
jgi:DNA-binding transcriptional regulator YbjK